jgi:hypothetical protein
MSMTNQEEFAARLSRVNSGAPNTKGTIFVGQDEQHHMTRETPQKVSKGKEVASNALYPLSLVGAFGLGMVAVAIGRYARFQLWAGRDALSDDADMEMAISFGVGILLSFVLAQMFRITSKEHKGLQAIGVFVMVCAFHNFAHWAPGPMSALFSPQWVATVQTESPPNSAKFRGLYFPLFDTGSALAATDPIAESTTEATADAAEPAALPDCPVKAGAEVVMLQTENAKKPKKGAKNGHKTLTAAESGACKTP